VIVASFFLLAVGVVVFLFGLFIIRRTRSGWIGLVAGILFLLGIYLILVGLGVLPPFSA
jgi:hypothetical protein